jgi:hypothetical protein
MEFQPLQPTRPKALTLEDILAQFDAIDQVIFEPIQLQQHRDAPALLAPTFQATSCPFNYFTLNSMPYILTPILTNQAILPYIVPSK